jgi:MinD superfamily P-loop ATPase
MVPQVAGRWLPSDSRYGPLLHAALRPAQENSGKLLAVVRERARALATDTGSDVVLIDGPPGIGCPVIAAVAGTDMALVVAEPTAAGIHDLARALATTTHFSVPALVCINKADLHPEGTAEIDAFCQAHGIDVIGRIPFDMAVSQDIVAGYPVTVFRPNSLASLALRAVWERVRAALNIDVVAVPA